MGLGAHAIGTKLVSKNKIHANFEIDKLRCFSCYSRFLFDKKFPLFVAIPPSPFFSSSLFFFTSSLFLYFIIEQNSLVLSKLCPRRAVWLGNSLHGRVACSLWWANVLAATPLCQSTLLLRSSTKLRPSHFQYPRNTVHGRMVVAEELYPRRDCLA